MHGPVQIIPPPCPADLNEDLTVNVLDLIDLLLCFGQPAVPVDRRVKPKGQRPIVFIPGT